MTQPMDQPRPAQIAALLLAAASSPPRQRARDQQADLVGNQLKQRILHRIVELDPDGATLEKVMASVVAEIGEPVGPTRAIARLVTEELAEARRNPEFTQWLLDEAVRSA